MTDSKDKFLGFFGQLAQENKALYDQTAAIEYKEDTGFVKPGSMTDDDFKEFERLLEDWLAQAPE